MKFIPSYKFSVIPEEEFPTAIKDIEQKLEEIKVSGNFKAFDGTNMYYEYFLAENSTASVVIVHGLSEFTKKFYEFAYYLLNRGFNVFIYDQRCHGLSGRLTKEMDLLHVDKFNDYVRDLAQFVDDIVLKTEDKPLYLYSHSMGGAISTFYLSQHPNKIKRAVLAAPMFEPIVDCVPMPIARGGVKMGKLFLGKKKKFPLSHEFNPNVQYKESHGSSRVRFEYNLKMRIDNLNYRSTPMSFSWTDNSINIGRKILSKKVINNIKTPILLISAGNDTVVNNELHYKFAEKYSGCRLVNIENETHALLASNNETLTKIVNLTFDFYSK